MRTVPIHWLLIVCFLASPISHGAQAEMTSMTPRDFATALMSLAARPMATVSAKQPANKAQAAAEQQPRDLHAASTLAPWTPATPRSSEVPTAQPAGP